MLHVVARNAMMSIIRVSLRALLLASVAVMVTVAASLSLSGKLGPGAGGPPAQLGRGPGPIRFVCAHCTATSLLSSGGLFLNRASVRRRHIAACKHCRAADLGYREIHVEARAGDVMAGAGVLRGPRRISDTSRQVTRASRAETFVYDSSANQGEK
jgi:hypothetical protein